MINQYFMPTRVVLGDNCIWEQRAHMGALGKHALIVTGSRSAKSSGALDDVIAALDAQEIAHTVFNGVVPNPSVESVYAGVAMAKSCGADFVVAIGGGSPMDTAKAICLVAKQDIPEEQLFSGKFSQEALPLVCIPTTSGTGSEVTQYSIITNEAKQTKTALVSAAIFPRVAYLDARYTYALPQRVTVNTAIDALSHSIEGMMSPLAGPLTDALAKDSIKRITDCFDALLSGDLTPAQRESLMLASTLGGMVIANTGTTVVHAMGYALTYFRDCEHGRANGLLISSFMELVTHSKPERIQEIMDACGCADLAEFRAKLDKLLGEKEAISAQDAADWAALTASVNDLKRTPIPLTQNDLEWVYRRSFGLEV